MHRRRTLGITEADSAISFPPSSRSFPRSPPFLAVPGNAKALEVFECDWASFTALPSRKSSPADSSDEKRQALLEAAEKVRLEG